MGFSLTPAFQAGTQAAREESRFQLKRLVSTSAVITGLKAGVN